MPSAGPCSTRPRLRRFPPLGVALYGKPSPVDMPTQKNRDSIIKPVYHAIRQSSLNTVCPFNFFDYP